MTALPLLDKLLMRYAAGNLSKAEQLVIAVHVSLNTHSRKKVAHYEAIGGRIMQEESLAEIHVDCLDSILRRIDDCPPCEEQEKAKTLCPEKRAAHADIPDVVHMLLDGHCHEKELCWSQKSGFDVIDLSPETANPCTLKLFLLRLKPHQETLAHSHTGTEITVVLAGSYKDEAGSYRKGDIAIITDGSFVHTPVAEAEGCLCLTLASGPLRFI